MSKLLVFVLAVEVMMLGGCAGPQGRTQEFYQYRDTAKYNSQPMYTQSAQDEYNKKLIKQGLLGAATGAIAAETSGGKAGTGALVGAGTNIIGGALFDVLTAPATHPQQAQYAPYATQWNQQNPNLDRVIRKYDSTGNILSEEVYTS